MNRKWKTILIAIIMLPMVVFFNGCSCSCSEDGSTNNNINGNSQYTVQFYLGINDPIQAKASHINPQKVNAGELLIRPVDPIWSGHRFSCWSLNPDPNNYTPWEFSINKVNSNITLYAKWLVLN